MALSRIKNWVAEILTHADLNAEFNNIINNALSLVSPLTGNLDVNSKTLSNVGTISGTPTFSSTTTFTGAATFSAAINEAHGADIASAATINLTTATGNLVDVTGTTGITAITLAEGAERTTRFTGALTITNGASLVLQGNVDKTTVAGDFAIWRGYAAGVVRMVHYGRLNGESLTLIRSQTASASATIDFTSGINSSFDEYLVVLTNIIPATNTADLVMRISTATVFVAGAGYHWTRTQNSEGTGSFNGSAADSKIILANSLQNAATTPASGEVRLFGASNTAAIKIVNWHMGYYSSANQIVTAQGSGTEAGTATAIDGIRFLMSSGNITSGTLALYGVRKT